MNQCVHNYVIPILSLLRELQECHFIHQEKQLAILPLPSPERLRSDVPPHCSILLDSNVFNHTTVTSNRIRSGNHSKKKGMFFNIYVLIK